MHAFEPIPFVAVMGAAAFAATSIAWDSDRRATGAMSALFGCAGLWALCDLLAQLESEPGQAGFWLRLAFLPAFLLAPCVLALLAQMLPQSAPRLRPWLPVALPWALAAGVAAAVLPGTVLAVGWTPWGGWVPRHGAVALGCLLLALAPVGLAVATALRIEPRPGHRGDRPRARAVVSVVVFSVLATLGSEALAPALDLPLPRLGALAVVVAAGSMWLWILHETDDLALTPYGIARSVLAELQEGVALLEPDGTLRFANARLADLVGRPRRALTGAAIGEWLELPFEALCDGLRDRETRLRRADRTSLPVAVSSCRARDRLGGAIGVVVVVRDLRDLEMLRHRLVSSGRLAAMGELAAGIAHEVNNPVAFIRADLNYLGGRLEELDEQLAKPGSGADRDGLIASARARVERVIEAVTRIAEVVGDVRDFAHVGGAAQGGSDPARLLEGALRLARLERGDEVEVRFETAAFSERYPFGQELKQVLLTLLRLLVDGSARGGRVDVALEAQPGALRIELVAARMADAAEGLLARFEEARLRGPESRRSDLGLAIALGLVEQLGGRISMDHAGVGGLRIALRLPLPGEGEA